MSELKLKPGLYLYPTPAGAYQAISTPQTNKPGRFLQRLLQQPQTPALTLEELCRLAETDDEAKVLELLHHCQQLGWVQGVDEVLSAPQTALEILLPGLLISNMGIASHAWAIVDVFGCSQIGFWPLFIGDHHFVIAIAGIPHFNQAEFVTLIWALSIRYAKKDSPKQGE
jgi:hypothetical protein